MQNENFDINCFVRDVSIFEKNTNRRQNERQTMEKFWSKWFAKKIIKWKRKKNWNQTAFMPCVRLWFAINFFSSCFYILLCLLAITPLWLYCYRDYRNGSFWSWIKCRNKRTKSTTFIFATTKKKKMLQSNADCRAYSDHAVKKAKSKWEK